MGIDPRLLPKQYRDQVLRQIAGTPREKRGNKLHAEKVKGYLADGTPHVFDSKREQERYGELCVLLRAGEITDLQVQVKYLLVPAQRREDGKTEHAVSYIADFVYQRDGKTVVEDSKGYRDPRSAAYAKFVIKRKLMLWVHGITVIEV